MATKEIIKPVLTALTPNKGVAGDRIVITGSGFVDGNNIHGVFFGDVAAPDWHVADDGTIVEVLVPDVPPAGPGNCSVVVRTEGGIDNFGGEPQESPQLSFHYTA